MSRDFEGKVVVITGGGGALGGAVAITVAKGGAKVVLVDLRQSAMDETKKKIEDAAPGAEVFTITADCTKASEVKRYVDESVKKFGRIDGFHNNAGAEALTLPLTETDDANFEKLIAINLMGTYYGLKYVLKVMKEQGSGYIVNTSSCSGILACPNITPYVATKHAVVGLTRSAAIEYGEFGISVNAVAPGAIMTPMLKASFVDMAGPGGNWEDVAKAIAQPNPKKRLGQDNEVGELVAFLLSGKAPYVNGDIISIDGGQSAAYFS